MPSTFLAGVWSGGGGWDKFRKKKSPVTRSSCMCQTGLVCEPLGFGHDNPEDDVDDYPQTDTREQGAECE
jgi:hypothetical protein